MVNQALPLRALRFIRDKVVYRFVMASRFSSRSLANLRRGSQKDFFITIAFNDSRLTSLQLQALRNYVQGDVTLLIVDNSNKKSRSSEIRKVATQFGGRYVRAPRNLFSFFDPSLSHASTLDWVWKRLLVPLSPRRVVFLDHDIFPVATFSVDDFFLNRELVGFREERAEMWYLWPGLLGLDLTKITRRDLSFLPYRELDTGGSLWGSIYKNRGNSEVRFITKETHVILPGTFKQQTSVEILDGSWLHLIDGSGWMDGKQKLDRMGSLNDLLELLPLSRD